MYTFRIIEKSGVISNHELGDAYSVFRKDETKLFSKIMLEEFPDSNQEDITSLVKGQNGAMFFVTKSMRHFIMTDSGKTLERL